MDRTTAYLARLTEGDLRFLASVSGGHAETVATLRAEPARIVELIDRSEVYDALFAPWSEHPFALASPFLAFSVLLAGAARELGSTSFVREWIGPRQRIPVFDVEALRGFLDDRMRRVFLADVLASYTHVASGTVWIRGRRGWTRRRFNELDPVRLAALLEVVPQGERIAVVKRLGDLALFLTGVFPDAAERLFRPVQIERIERTLAEAGGARDDVPEEPPGAVGLLERLGRRSYRTVAQVVQEPLLDTALAVAEVAERFGEARRVLNFLTDRHLFPLRDEWFPWSG
ncbi:MAG TPA: hypothetical protein VE669_06235 [Actinomycetota bacterium]|nr:hypothetical protein [Actinomycetota bacterium]